MSDGWSVIASGQRFPEGPLFTTDGTLWWVEIDGAGFGWHRDGEFGRMATGGRPNGAAVGPDGLIWFCGQGDCAIRTLDPASGLIRTLVTEIDGRRLGKPNDLIFDGSGNLIFTCPNDGRHEPSGYVCCLTAEGALTTLAEGLYFANGLALLPGGRLVIAETYRQRLVIGGWDPATRAWADPRPWIETGGPIGPDGMALSESGLLHVAVFGQGQIIVVDPQGGIVDRLTTPGSRPTNCCFDPCDPTRLIVTEAERGAVIARRLKAM